MYGQLILRKVRKEEKRASSVFWWGTPLRPDPPLAEVEQRTQSHPLLVSRGCDNHSCDLP